MPVFYLNDQLWFPDPELAQPDGLLAVGGDLSLGRLKLAYDNGIFPWYSQEPVLWFNPDPRMVLFPENFHISKSLKKTLDKKIFEVTFDQDFEKVICSCAKVHRHKGTWITNGIISSYIQLHEAGRAHSVECWSDSRLVGGLYGVTSGAVFCGESMFYLAPDASKVALAHLVGRLIECGYTLLDCQVHTDNMARFGAGFISRSRYLEILRATRNVMPL